MPRRPEGAVGAARGLVIAHDASRTGACLQLLGLLRHWSTEGPSDVAWDVVLRRPGPLAPELARYASVYRLTPPPLRAARAAAFRAHRLEPFERVMTRRLVRTWARTGGRAQGLTTGPGRVVYSNTVTNAAVVEELHRRGHRVVIHAHELRRAALANANREAVIRSLRLAHGLIANSQATAADLADLAGLDEASITVVHPYLDETAALSPATARSGGVVACGALTELKGVGSFLEVAARVRDRTGRPVPFTWVGDGPQPGDLQRWRREAERRGLAGVVTFTGGVLDPTPYLQGADVFAFFSREDGFGVVNLEAARAGLPVVCVAGSGGAPEFVGLGAGIVAESHDPDLLAGHVVELLADAALRQRLGHAGQELVRERYRVERVSAQVLQVLAAAGA